MRYRKWLASFAWIAVLIVVGLSPRIQGQGGGQGGTAAAQNGNGRKVPVFDVDTTFPKLPNNWVLGNVSKVVVDRHDNVWFIHRPQMPGLKVPEGKTPAPPVLEFDATGKFLQAWGGPAAGYDWPDTEHNIFVDQKDNVYITGSSPNNSKTSNSDDMLLKFTDKGKFILQIGGRNASLGNKDPKSVNKPGDLFVDSKKNEIYAADGYGNRRVIVFDADNGSFKRMWGAFGRPVEDVPGAGGRGAEGGTPAGEGGGRGGRGAPPVLETTGDGPQQFALVHSVAVSNDNIVYVGDRSNRRVQLFTPEGKYIKEFFINRAGPSASSVAGLAFSPDKEEQFLYVADYGNSHIVVVDRKSLEVLYQFGKRSAAPGDFQGVHHLAVDSKGNLYTAEVAPGARIQRFAFKGLSSTLPPNALSQSQLAP
jgi:DNA-binding beta-propeller fold protein YncE